MKLAFCLYEPTSNSFETIDMYNNPSHFFVVKDHSDMDGTPEGNLLTGVAQCVSLLFRLGDTIRL